jgi:hypothetical protein
MFKTEAAFFTGRDRKCYEFQIALLMNWVNITNKQRSRAVSVLKLQLVHTLFSKNHTSELVLLTSRILLQL